jgi:50S ribosomal subunit-associated GTPase HflX
MNKNAKNMLLYTFYKSKNLNLNWNQIDVIQRAASKAQKNAEHFCNGVYESDEYEKKTEQLMNRIAKTFTSDMPKMSIQGDPRGFCLRITLPNGEEIQPHYFN